MSRRIHLGPISKYWWMPLVSGLICIGLGIWTLVAPQYSLPVLAYVFAGCLCLAGIVNLVYSSMMGRYNVHWGWGLVIGILDIVAGVWLFTLSEGMLTQTFMIIIGIWILCVAINSIVEACVMSAYSPGWILLMVLLLAATIVLAIMLLSSPAAGAVTVWLWLAISPITYGCYRIMLASRIKTLGRTTSGMI